VTLEFTGKNGLGGPGPLVANRPSAKLNRKYEMIQKIRHLCVRNQKINLQSVSQDGGNDPANQDEVENLCHAEIQRFEWQI
jgi:hypothetical protein